MAIEVDSLQIEISASSQSAEKSIDKLISKLDKLQSGLSAMKVENIGNISDYSNNVGKSFVEATKSVKDFNKMLQNAGKTKMFTGNMSQLSDEITKNENKLNNLLSSEEKYVALGKNLPNSKSWKALQYNIAETCNYLDTLYDLQKQLTESKPLNFWERPDYIEKMNAESQIAGDSIDYTGRSNTINELLAKFGSLNNLPKYQMDITSLVQATSDIEKFDAEAEEASESVEDISENVTEVSQKVSVLSNKMSILKNLFSNMSDLKLDKSFKNIGNNFSKSIKQISTRFNSFIKSAVRKMEQIPRMFAIMLAFTTMGKAMQLAAEQMDNLYLYSEKMGTGFSKNLDMLKSGFLYLGRGIVTAFEPILSAVAPILDTLIRKVVDVLNAFNQFFSALTGADTWTRAVYEAEDYGEAVEGAGKAQKELNKQLSKLDELNVLNTSTSGGGGGSNGGADGSGFVTEEVPVETNDFIEKLKEAWEKADFTEIGKTISEKLQNALKSIDWDKVMSFAKNFGKSLATFLNGLITPGLFSELSSTLANSLNTALNFLHSFGKNFNFINFGNSIAEGINDFFETFDFKLLSDTIKTWIKGAIDAVSTFFNKTDFEMIGETIGKFLADLDLASYLDDIADILWKALKAGFELITGIASEAPLETTLISIFSAFKFTNLLSSLSGKFSDIFVSIFDTIKATDIWAKISTAIATLGSNLVYFLTEDLAVIFGAGTFVEIGATLVAGIAGAIAAAIGGFKLGEWLNENTGWGDIATWIVEDLGLGDLTVKILDIFDEVKTNIEDAIKNIKDWWKNNNKLNELSIAIPNILEKIKEKWDNVKDWWKERKSLALPVSIPAIKTLLKDKFNLAKDWWKDNKKLSNISIGVDSIITTVKTAWDKFKAWWDKVNFIKIEFDATTFAYKLAGFINSHIIMPLNNNVLIPLRNIPLIGDKIKILDYVSYETGGFPEDGWFRANHGEVMGRFDNGKSVVANNKQITDGIANAVYRGNTQMVSVMQEELSATRRQNELLAGQNELLLGILQKTGISYKDVFNATQKGASEYTAMTGRPAFV